jgi:hypothetical protein
VKVSATRNVREIDVGRARRAPAASPGEHREWNVVVVGALVGESVFGAHRPGLVLNLGEDVALDKAPKSSRENVGGNVEASLEVVESVSAALRLDQDEMDAITAAVSPR